MPSSSRRRGTTAVLSLLLLAAIGVGGVWLVVTTLFGGQSQSFGSVLRSILIAILIPATIAGVVALVVRDRRRLAALRELRPGAHVFVSRRSRELRDVLDAAGISGVLGASFAVAVTDEGVELWRSSRDTTAASSLPWTDLIAGRVGTAHVEGTRALESPAVILTTSARSGSAVLPIFVDRRAGGADGVLAEIRRRQAGHLARASR